MLLLGLTGGIGSGKSTVAELLADRGAVIVDADRVAREVVEPGGPAYQPLIDRFGSDIVKPDGTLDRAALAALAFPDPEALADLNRITHPAIRDRIAGLVAAQAETDRVVILDAALLDLGMRGAYGLAGVVVVDTPVDVAVDRLVRQRGLTEDDARARMAAQASRDERRKIADVLIDNSGSVADLEAEVARAWSWIEGLRAQGPG
jgi:dephospho-CoA kinase